MSFSLVYWSFCKSSLRIGSCQTSSPKIHIGASNAPRSHFNTPGSSRVRRCQSLLQHTWLVLQLCEISVFTGAGKKRFLSFGKHNSGPRASRLWGAGVVFSSSEDKSDLGGFWWLQNSTGDTLGQPSLAQHPQNSLFSWKRKLSRCVRFQQEMSSRCWICAPSVAQDRVSRGVSAWGGFGCSSLIPAHPALPQIHSQLQQKTQKIPGADRKWTLPLSSHLVTASLTFPLWDLTFNIHSSALVVAQLYSGQEFWDKWDLSGAMDIPFCAQIIGIIIWLKNKKGSSWIWERNNLHLHF